MKLLSAIVAHNVDQANRLKLMFTDVSSFMESTDLNVWAGREVLTVNDFNLWLDLNSCYSDRYKDLWGCRPHSFPQTLSDLKRADENISKEVIRELEYERKAKLEEARQENIRAAKDRIRKKRSNNFGAMVVHEELSKAFSKFV